MPINAHPDYLKAEQEYLLAQTIGEKIECLQKMISLAPSHKGAENLSAGLKTRLKKLKEKQQKAKKSGRGKKEGIKKADMQAVIAGLPNTGKSSLFKSLTGQNVKISPNPFATYEPELGTMNFEDVKIQLIDMPPFPSHNTGIINSTDTILAVVENLEQLSQTEEFIKKSPAQKIIVFNKSDLLNEAEKRKTSSYLQSKKYNFALFPSVNGNEELKNKIFETFPIIRIYTKEPKKPASRIPMILKKDSSLKNAAEKILKGMSEKIKRARIWGPSSKFGGQVIGVEHILKDRDIIEFQTK